MAPKVDWSKDERSVGKPGIYTFEVEHAEFYPMTNHTMDQARKHKLTISACIIGRRPA